MPCVRPRRRREMAVCQAPGQRDGRLPGTRPARWPFARHPASSEGRRPPYFGQVLPKLTCVGTGPRPRRVCRHWGFCGRGIGVFWVQALVFLRPRHWCFWVQALVFLWSWHWCFCGRGIGVFVVAALGRVDPLRTLATGRVGGQALRFSAV